MVKHMPTMWETQVRSLGWEDLLEKGMATHFSILAWRIPWTENPGRPQSMGLQGGSEGKESTCNAGDLSLIPGSGRSSGEENGNPLQYSCLENPMDRGAWWATVHGVPKSQTGLRTNFHFHSIVWICHGAAITICSDFGVQKK